MTARDGLNLVVALGLLVAATAQIALPLPLPGVPVALLLGIFVFVNRREVTRSAAVIGAIVGVLFVWSLATGILGPSGAMARVTFLSVLLMSLNMLSRAASRSPDVRDAAEVVASRPRGARYLFVTVGTHVFSIFLNFGAVSVIAALLAQSRETLVRQNALRDLTLSMIRGFGAMPMWSPLALSTIITLSILPEVGYFEVLPFGLAAAGFYMTAGYLMSRRGAAPQPPSATRAMPGRADRRVLGRVVLRVGLLVCGAIALQQVTALTLPEAVLFAVLAFALGWWAMQSGDPRRPGIAQEAAASAATTVNEIVIVGGAGFIGAVISEAISRQTGGLPVPPDAVFPLAVGLIPFVMVGAGLVAVNPIVSTSILLGVLHPLVPESILIWMAVAAKTGWGITAAASPFTANVLIAGRVMGLPGGELVRSDNLRLTLLTLAVTSLFCAAATYLSL
jgi:hypothetical protein